MVEPRAVSLVNPTVDGWEPRDCIRDVQCLIEAATQQGQVGPYAILFGAAWHGALAGPYRPKRRRTLMARLLQLDPVILVCCIQSLPGYSVQLFSLAAYSE
jgi:hypothetical protein